MPMSPLPRLLKQLFDYTSIDGFVHQALLVTTGARDDPDTLERPIIVQVHGVLGNFLARGTPRLLPEAMYTRGISTLSTNNRMSFLGQILGWGIFDDMFHDIDASLDLVRSMGFKSIYLLGYSLGANLAVYYLHKKPDHGVKGLILEGCSFSLPDSQRNRYNHWKSIPSYDRIYTRAQSILSPDPYTSQGDQVFAVYRAWGDDFRPSNTELFTYRTWWFMRGPEAINAKTYKLMSSIDIPVLLIQGTDDYIVEQWEPQVLARIARRGGNSRVSLRFIPEARHDCMENPEFTADLMAEWVASNQ